MPRAIGRDYPGATHPTWGSPNSRVTRGHLTIVSSKLKNGLQGRDRSPPWHLNYRPMAFSTEAVAPRPTAEPLLQPLSSRRAGLWRKFATSKHINTHMMQQVLARPHWAERLTATDLRALTPLIWEHVNPYGRFGLNMESRARSQAKWPLGDTTVGRTPCTNFCERFLRT